LRPTSEQINCWERLKKSMGQVSGGRKKKIRDINEKKGERQV